MKLSRRNFLNGAACGGLAMIIPAGTIHLEESLFGYQVNAIPESRARVAGDLVEMMEGYGTHRHPTEGYYYSGYGRHLFTWETFFDTIALLHAGDTTLARNTLRIYLSLQRKDGLIPRSWVDPDAPSRIWFIYASEEHAQPFLFQIALFLTRANGGDASWITDEMYLSLKRYLDHWTTAWDRDSNGLSEWASACHSGEDNQLDRVGVWRSYFCEGVDLNTFLYMDCLAAEKIALAKGNSADAAAFAKSARDKKELIQKLLWNEEDGFYYDRDIRTGKPIRVKSVAGLYPLWAGIPDPAQAKRIVAEHIMNPKEFWCAHPLPSYAISERNYTQHHVPDPQIDINYALGEGHSNWRGGVWGHSNYFVTHGLQRYGFQPEARLLAEKSYEMSAPDRVVFEWYNAENGEGLGSRKLYAGAEILMRFLPTELATDFQPMLIADCDKPISNDGLRKALELTGAFRIKA